MLYIIYDPITLAVKRIISTSYKEVMDPSHIQKGELMVVVPPTISINSALSLFGLK